ncbi:unnamed protein product, partial [Rangifer tarandus platyrhynchus]
MPSHRTAPSPTSRGLAAPGSQRRRYPAGRSGPRLSPRRGRSAASPAWRPRGSPSPALRRSNVTRPAPTVTSRANRVARPSLSVPRAARRRNPVLRRPPLPSAPSPTLAQFHLYSQAQVKTTSPTGQSLRLRNKESYTPHPLKETPRPQGACVLGILNAPSTSDVVCTPSV